VISYFANNQSKYLLFQALNMGSLAISYFFSCEYFAMIGIIVSMARTITFFLISKKGKDAPLALSFLFAFLNLLAYVIINLFILKTTQPIAILYVIALVAYSFIFRIKSMKKVRFLMLLPLTLTIAFNVFSNATIFAAISYVFELIADVIAIIKNDLKKQNLTQKT
jgi:hypothetical protein